MANILIILGGLPGTGKTTIARELARQIGAVHVRIDSIEQAIRDCANVPALDVAGYRVGYAIAIDNLRIGRTVIADSVNPLSITRDAWREVGRRTQATTIEIEVTCSDRAEHRRRVESRISDIPGLNPPTWDDVISRECELWSREHLRIDTSGRDIEECVRWIRERLGERQQAEPLH